MSIFRSAEMKFYHLHIPKQYAYEVISKLGNQSFVQFVDAIPNAFHRPYYNSMKRCEQIIQKVDLITRQVRQNKITLPEVPLVETIFENQQQYLKTNKISSLSLLDKIQDEVQRKFAGLDKLNKSLADFSNKVNELQDYKYLLFKARQIFHSKKVDGAVEFDKISFNQMRLLNIAGVINVRDLQRFTKMIFRVSKGNSILYTFNIPQQEGDKSEPRAAFLIVIESGDILYNKITRICDSFGASKHKIPTDKDQMFNKIKEIEDSITDTKQLHMMTEKQLKEDIVHCIQVGQFGCARYDAFRIILEKEYLIFNVMNLLESTHNIMIAKIWVPSDKYGLLLSSLPSFVSLRENEFEGKPPSHFQVNAFTAPFQQIVNTYGIPRYQEVNAGLYAIPVFPFLFGVMFGDIGHGGVLLCFAIWLIYSDYARKKLADVYDVRYLLLLMGTFSFYSGWIYNQFFSIPLNVFGSCYGHAKAEQYAQKEEGCVYPIGFDPKWIRSSNELNYFNSYKMKFAVIIGVLQMTFAIGLKLVNTRHFRSYLDMIFEWLPQQVFFFCTFGYMCVLIIYKWTIPWGIPAAEGQQYYDTANAPSIIGQMIALPLALGSTEGKPLWDKQSQQSLQYNLLMVALICVPWMLIPKPLIIWARMSFGKESTHHVDKVITEHNLAEELRDSFKQGQQQMHVEKAHNSTRSSEHKKAHGDEEHDISEIAVHQIIQTIQFVLGSISNTASYLRLWALSLAHGQLSKVFLEKTIGGGITGANIPVILIGMYLFFNITLGVIMGMDTMECFLHAIRLQWVEFQSKFFKADGWKFQALTFVQPVEAKIIATRQEE